MTFTYVMIFSFCIILGFIAFYIINSVVMPKKIDEIAKMIDIGQAKAAIKKLNEMIEKDDHNPFAHYLLARAYVIEGNSQYGIVEYRQVLKFGRFDERMREADIRRALAKMYMDKKAVEEAKKEYLILTKIEPNNFENYFESGRIFFNTNVYDKAIGFFKKAVSLNDQNEESFYYLGQIYYRNNMHPEAKQMLTNAVKINPKNYKAHYFLGLVLRQMNDYEWAIKEFDTAEKSDDLKVKCYLAKGSCYLEKGGFPKAIQEFEKGLKYVRKGTETELNLRYFLAECHEKMRDIHSAIVNWERIVEVNPKFRDVNEKLRNFSEFRQDDRIKDFMIAGLSQFEHMCRKMVQAMGFNISEIEIISDTEIEMIVTESEGKWRNARQTNRIVRINRTTEKVSESLLRKLHESMKLKNSTRVMMITTGEYSSKAVEFANTRPIDILSKSDLVDILKKI